MNLFNRSILLQAIRERKEERPYVRIEKIDGDYYYLRDSENKCFGLHIAFANMIRRPRVGDGFYLSEIVIEYMRQNCHSFTFSKKIGERYARPPHDFLKNPEEFLIVEYQNGKTILLEQWYG